MAQERKPLELAPRDGTPFLAWEPDEQYPCVAVFSEDRGRFIVPARRGFMGLSVCSEWTELPQAEAA